MEEKIDKLLSEITNLSTQNTYHHEELEAQYKNSGGYTLKAKASKILIVLLNESKHTDLPLDLSDDKGRTRVKNIRKRTRLPNTRRTHQPS